MAQRKRAKTPPKGNAAQTIIMIPPPPPPAPPVTRTAQKEKPMATARRPPQKRAKLPSRVSQHVGISYSKTVGDGALEVGCSIAEGTMALLSVAADYAADSTETDVDNKALGYVKPIVGTTLRVLAGRGLAKKHPGLAEIARSGASAWNGDSYGQSWRRAGVRVQEKTLRRVAGAEGGK